MATTKSLLTVGVLLLLLLTACSTDPRPVQLTFVVKDSTVVASHNEKSVSVELILAISGLIGLIASVAGNIAQFLQQKQQMERAERDAKNQHSAIFRSAFFTRQLALIESVHEVIVYGIRAAKTLAHGGLDPVRYAGIKTTMGDTTKWNPILAQGILYFTDDMHDAVTDFWNLYHSLLDRIDRDDKLLEEDCALLTTKYDRIVEATRKMLGPDYMGTFIMSTLSDGQDTTAAK